MPDFSDIPDEAWIDVVAAVGWDESNELWPVLQTALAAALPVLNTARDAETTERLAKVWPDPFGHWTAEEAEAARAMKRALLSRLPLPASRDSETAALRAEIADRIERYANNLVVSARMDDLIGTAEAAARNPIKSDLLELAASLRGEQP